MAITTVAAITPVLFDDVEARGGNVLIWRTKEMFAANINTFIAESGL